MPDYKQPEQTVPKREENPRDLGNYDEKLDVIIEKLNLSRLDTGN